MQNTPHRHVEAWCRRGITMLTHNRYPAPPYHPAPRYHAHGRTSELQVAQQGCGGKSVLDKCNGKVLKKSGVYAYFVTPNYPYLPSCLRGAPMGSFSEVWYCHAGTGTGTQTGR